MIDSSEFEKRTLVECLVSGNAILAHVQLVPMESGFKYEWWLVSIEPLHCHIRVGADFYKGCCDMNDSYAVCWNEDDTATKPGLLTAFDLKNFKVIINNAYSRALDCAKLLPNNKLVIAFEKGEIEILDLNSKSEVSVIQMSNCYIQTMHLDPWSNQLVLWNADWSTKQLLWLDLDTAKIVKQIQVEPEDDELWRRPDFGFIDEVNFSVIFFLWKFQNILNLFAFIVEKFIANML